MDEAFLIKKIFTLFVKPVGMVLFLLLLAFIAIPSRKVVREKGGTDKEKNFDEKEASEGENADSAPSNEEGGNVVVQYKPTGGFASFLVAGAIFLLYGLSIKPVSDFLVAIVEKKVSWENMIPEGFVPSHIVILPGGARDVDLPSNSRLSYATFTRLKWGLRYWEQFPEAILVFSGKKEETSGMREEALRSGVPEKNIFVENKAQDTRGHAIHLKGLLEDEPFLLVTSAIHLPRALALFQGEGMTPLGVPVDFTVDTKGPQELEIRDLIPGAKFLNRSEHAFHEIVGLIWAQWRGQTG